MIYKILEKINSTCYRFDKYGIWYLVDKISKRKLTIFIKNVLYSFSLFRIKRKRSIKIAFVSVSASSWCGEELYTLFAKDDRFEPYIIVIPFYNGTEMTIKRMYDTSLEYYVNKGYSVEGTIKGSIYENKGWKECGSPDIIFYLNPHSGAFPVEWRVQKLPLSRVLPIYIPYSFMISDAPEMHYNQILHKLCWRIFAESQKAKEMANKYSDIGDSNVVVSGYSKMDVYFRNTPLDTKSIWKTSKKVEEVKKIIYSPHHSVALPNNLKNGSSVFSTFDQNYKFMLEMAKKYADWTSWVFKPHPLLEKGVLEAGVFKNDAEWKAYVEEWDNLPNGRAVLEGTYDDLFKSCDGIINDSVSFLAEILYAHKPMLFLKSDSNTFNEFGEELVQLHDMCYGTEFDKIEEFIVAIINGYKGESEQKHSFFVKNLDYCSQNGCLASEFIYKYIKTKIDLTN